MKYFAYGDKMFAPHLHSIAAEAVYLCAAKVMGYKLFFHSRGIEDFSGKCNIVPVKDPGSEVYGVLYDIPFDQRPFLDKAEGLGYASQETILRVFSVEQDVTTGERLEPVFAFSYVAHQDNIFEDLVPFTWYKAMIISGARAHGLPASYIQALEKFSAVQDSNLQRESKQKRYLELAQI